MTEIRVVTRPLMQTYRDERALIDALAVYAIEANPFFTPSFLIPWLDQFGTGKESCLWCTTTDGELIGVFPFLPTRSKLGVSTISLVKNEFIFHTVPLVRRDYVRIVLESILARTRGKISTDTGSHIDAIIFPEVIDDGNFADELSRITQQKKTRSVRRHPYERAYLFGGRSSEEFLSTALSKKRAKDLNKKQEKLSSALGGPVSLRVIKAPDAQIIARFLKLEGSGWKGTNGTAIQSNPVTLRFFEEMYRESGDSIEMFTLGTDEISAAMMITLRSQGTYFGYKIAYDETLKECSPGLLLLREMTDYLLKLPHFRAFDSCAAPNSELFARLWSDHRKFVSLKTSIGTRRGNLALRLESSALRLRKIAVRVLKSRVKKNPITSNLTQSA